MCVSNFEELSWSVTNNIRNCPEGASGKAARDIKALTVGSVVLVVLMKNAKMCLR